MIIFTLMKYKDKHSLNWASKQGNEVECSDRAIRRKNKKEIDKFSLKIKDIFWWKSLSYSDQYSIWRSYQFKSGYHSSISWFSSWIEEKKDEYPGHIQVKRDLVINDILK